MIINRDLTREKIWINVSGSQIYAEVFSKVHGKWTLQTYFQSYDFIVDKELMESTIRYIIKAWGLRNPKVFLAFGN